MIPAVLGKAGGPSLAQPGTSLARARRERRLAARPAIYMGFASSALGFANTMEDVWRRIAARPSICIGFASPAFGLTLSLIHI